MSVLQSKLRMLREPKKRPEAELGTAQKETRKRPERDLRETCERPERDLRET